MARPAPGAAWLLAIAGCVVSLLAVPVARGSALPSGFRDTTLPFEELEMPTAVRFSPDGRVFVSEKGGEILVYDSLEDPTPTVFADLRTQVFSYADRGLLGLALDPDFPVRPYVYALYTYDHVLGEPGQAPEWGSPGVTGDSCPKPPEADVDTCPVSGRLVRLTAVGDHAAEAGGEAKEDVLVEDWCQQFSSHSIGNLAFDPSGALYASGGDGASFYDTDFGQFGWPLKNQCGDPPVGVGELQEPPGAEGGALRSQDLRTSGDPVGLDGSLIRIDPDSGEGLPGNPLAASSDPNARRIVAYGFRNPFRFALDPASGEVYVANVGWNNFEEIDRAPMLPAAPFNSGWPCYEGPYPTQGYSALGLDLCENLYAEPGSTAPPFFSYGHGSDVAPGDGCSSEPGSAVSGIQVYRGGAFPAAYEGALFFADSVRGCIYVMYPDDDGDPDPLTTTTFMSEGGLYPGVDLEVGPGGDLYYVKFFGADDEGTIHRISYDPDAPIARLTADPPWGEADPLEVHLDASGSEDPGKKPLTYAWDLDGNGSFETSGQATRQANIAGPQKRTVAVRVSDGTQSSIARVTVYPGDTPPQPEILEPDESLHWRVGQEIDFSGAASDQEEPGGEVGDAGLSWKTRLFHCPAACHAHPLQVFPADGEGSFVAPDHDYPSYIELTLTATDSKGLAASKSVRIDPSTVDLAIDSDPAGLTLGAGLLSKPTPFVLRTIEGSSIVLSAPLTESLGGRGYEWSGWSDGGTRVHTIVADEPGSYTAAYRALEPLGPEAPERVGPPPAVAIRAHPAKRTRQRTASFEFASVGRSDPQFRCKLDRAEFAPCASPRTYRRLNPGSHAFAVFLVRADGTALTAPTRFRWRVLCPRRGTPAATRPPGACTRRAAAAGRRGR